MKKVLNALVLCLVLCAPGLAQNAADQPATKADVDRYLDAVHSHEMMDQMVVAMSKPIQKMLHEQYEKNKDRLSADFEARTSKEMEDMLKTYLGRICCKPWCPRTRNILPRAIWTL
jgi:transaldolase